jgi:hypothetical protein
MFWDNNFDFASLLVRECLRVKPPNWVFSGFPSWPPPLCWFAHVRVPDSRTQPSTDSRISRSSEVRAIDGSRFRASACSWLHFLAESRFPNPAHSRIRGFIGSRIPNIVNSPAPEKHVLRTLLSSTFRGWRVFLNSPTGPKHQSTACLDTLKPVKHDIKQIYPPHDTTCLKSNHRPQIDLSTAWYNLNVES